MDYQRIYREFIANRKAMESSLTGYTERHHIVPKSRGGANDPSNIISLTAEDHFFAHLLLAKIYRGRMWFAVRWMRFGRVGGERPWVRGRPMYAVARRRCAEETSLRCKGQPGKRDKDNARYDHTSHDWTNMDTGDHLAATKAEMFKRFGGSRAHWTSAVNGSRKTMLGWTVNPGAVRVRSSKGKRYQFVNRDGRKFEGTQSEFVGLTGLSVASASRVVKQGSVTICGWRLPSTPDWRPGYGRDGLPAKAKRDRNQSGQDYPFHSYVR
jgi:hypothetical protein